MTVGENIKRIRLQRGLTQDELGYLVGVAGTMIRKYELGIANPKPSKLETIAKALGVNVEVLKNSDFDNISAMHRLFQLFRQYDGYFDNGNNLHFHKLNLSSWHKRWNIYQDELKQAKEIPDVQERQNAIEDAKDKFNWWMDTYPKSDAFNIDFDKSLENYRKLKNKRRNHGKP